MRIAWPGDARGKSVCSDGSLDAIGFLSHIDRTGLPGDAKRATLVDLERMRYLINSCYNLTSRACEDALRDVPPFTEFRRRDLTRAKVPNGTALPNARNFLGGRVAGELLLANGGSSRVARQSISCCLPPHPRSKARRSPAIRKCTNPPNSMTSPFPPRFIRSRSWRVRVLRSIRHEAT